MQNMNYSRKFKNKYRIQSARLLEYDYSSDGAYFITICTKTREHFFGKIIEGVIQLSEMGKIVADEWQKTEKIRKNITLGEWVVMPNHFHGILIVDNKNNPRRDVLVKRLQTKREDINKTLIYQQTYLKKNKTKHMCPNGDVLPKRLYKNDNEHNGKNLKMSKISPTKNSISVAIRFFKRQTTIRLRKLNPLFVWQSRFHDHIIRNDKEFKKISEYIKENPMKWENDCYF